MLATDDGEEARTMGEQAQCWKCGAAVADQLLVPGRRVARQAECPQCRTELHVCRACTFYDTRVARHCRETIAEEVKDKTHANFCDYFQYREDAYTPGDDSAAEAARKALEDLFRR
jgi:hypothetical protein